MRRTLFALGLFSIAAIYPLLAAAGARRRARRRAADNQPTGRCGRPGPVLWHGSMRHGPGREGFRPMGSSPKGVAQKSSSAPLLERAINGCAGWPVFRSPNATPKTGRSDRCIHGMMLP